MQPLRSEVQIMLQCYSSIQISRPILKLEANNQVTQRFSTETINEHEFYLKYRYYRARICEVGQ